MNLFLLDAGGAGLLYVGLLLLILFMFLAIMLEVVVMIIMKYNVRFLKAFLDSFIVNVASLAAGLVLVTSFPGFFNDYTALNFILLYVITVLIEYGLLFLLNRRHRTTDTLKVAVVMNLVTYLVLGLFIGLN